MTDKIHFVFDPDNPALTWGDFSTIDMMRKKNIDMFRLQKLAARCLVDDNKNYLPFERALEILGELPRAEMEEALAKFGQAVTDSAVPKANGRSLSLPSAVDTPPVSPGGSQP